MKLSKILEALHKYDDFSYDAKFSPLKKGDTVRVFHGTDMNTSVISAKHGISGGDNVDRRYSDENNHNPKGLFVTVNPKIAKDFASGVRVRIVMEFIVNVSDLEAPVWPSGGYTVQGQISNYFPNDDRENRIARSKARKSAERTAKDGGNDNNHLADMLFNSSENQALFTGHMSPNNITFHVQSGESTGGSWDTMSASEFLSEYGDTDTGTHAHAKAGRVLSVDDNFDANKFMDGLGTKFWQNREYIADTMNYLRKGVLDNESSSGRKSEFINSVGRYMWPKQYRDAYKWIMQGEIK